MKTQNFKLFAFFKAVRFATYLEIFSGYNTFAMAHQLRGRCYYIF